MSFRFPPIGKDWQTWASALSRALPDYLESLRWKLDNDRPHKNGIVLWDELERSIVVSIDGKWEPVMKEFDVYLAEQEILNTFGDRVSVIEKKKTLIKFGHNEDIGTSRATIWNTGSDEDNETYVTTDAITSISSSSGSDTVVINIEGHTVTGTGSSSQFTFTTQTATLNGQNAVTLTTPLARVSRAYVDNGSTLLGDVYIHEGGTLSGGKPTTTTEIHLTLRGTHGDTQSFKGATTLSNVDYGIATGGYMSIDKKQAASVDFQLEVRMPGGNFRPTGGRVALNSTGQSAIQVVFKPHAIIPKNSDVRITAKSSSSGTECNVTIQMYLAKVIG